MTDFILFTGDKAMFLPNFGPALVVPRPGILRGSGPATLRSRRLCVVGDEKKVTVPGCLYMTPQYSIPGTGTLKIAALAADQRARKTRSGHRKLMLKGTFFTARFQVQNPAKQPPPGPGSPIPDPTPQYMGRGMFLTANLMFRAT